MIDLLHSSWHQVRRAKRYSRLALNLLGGSLIVESCYRLPRLSRINERTLNDVGLFRQWVDDLAYSLNVELHVYGEIMPEHGLFVSNHVSWIDTVLINKIKQVSFLARHDLEHWPALGTFTKRMQTVYVDRSNKRQAYRSIPMLEERLMEGRSVHFFPESTTSDGTSIMHFYPMFFEAAVRTQRPVQPVLVRYTDKQMNPLVEAAYINDDSFGDTLARILRVDKVHAHYYFLPVLDPRTMDRKELARRSRQSIESCLASVAGPVNNPEPSKR